MAGATAIRPPNSTTSISHAACVLPVRTLPAPSAALGRTIGV